VIFCALARRPLGNHVARHPGGAAVIVPGRRFPEYLAVMCGLIRRYGAHGPTVADALLRLLEACADVAGDDPELCTAIDDQAQIIIADAEREMRCPPTLSPRTPKQKRCARQCSGTGPRHDDDRPAAPAPPA
jgi:uncharacterized membrane protein